MSLRKSISTRLVRFAHYIDPETTVNVEPEGRASEVITSAPPQPNQESDAVAIKRERTEDDREDQSSRSSQTTQTTPASLPWRIRHIPVGVSINMIADDREAAALADEGEREKEGAEPPPSKKPRVRNEGCEALAERYSFEADKHAEFDEPAHKYTIHNNVVKRSVTTLVHELFEPFDGKLIVNKHYDNWKRREDPRYIEFINQATNEGGLVDDNRAKQLIVQSWLNEGKKASDFGTKMHLYAEQMLNWNGKDSRPTPHEDVQLEGTQFDAFMESDFVKELELEPIRTELTVYYMRAGVVVTAGQIDALFRSKKTQQYYILDWKRIKPEKRIDAQAHAFRNGIGLASSTPDTQHYQYSLQTSVYSLMLRESHGIDAEDNLYLVRMHADRSQGYELVKCTDLRPLAYQLLTQEYTKVSKAENDQAVGGETAAEAGGE